MPEGGPRPSSHGKEATPCSSSSSPSTPLFRLCLRDRLDVGKERRRTVTSTTQTMPSPPCEDQTGYDICELESQMYSTWNTSKRISAVLVFVFVRRHQRPRAVSFFVEDRCLSRTGYTDKPGEAARHEVHRVALCSAARWLRHQQGTS